MKIFTCLLFCCASYAFAQKLPEKEIKTKIDDVTVFLEGAQIFESGSANVPEGKTLLIVKNLSPFVDDKSVQVKADGDFTILSVNHKLNYLNLLKRESYSDSLQLVLDNLKAKMVEKNVRLEVLAEKRSLLDHNKSLRGENANLTMVQLKQALDFYEAEMSRIKEEEITINKTIEKNRTEQERISQQIKEFQAKKVLPTSEIQIVVKAERQISTKFFVSYLVGNAGWFPKYDIRVKNIKSPLGLTYKAEVFQNTGVDWKNVKLRFSNGTPNQSGVAPKLQPWNLTFARYTNFDKQIGGYKFPGTVKGKVLDDAGIPVAGVNVVIKGTTIGTVTDPNGNYSLVMPDKSSSIVFSFIGYNSQEIQPTSSELNVNLTAQVTQLQEVVVAGYGGHSKNTPIKIRGLSSNSSFSTTPMRTTFVEAQTTVEIVVNEPYSINSDGEKLMVDLKNFEIASTYEYHCVPKIDKDAFLTAQIVNWNQYNLLEGEANLYFEDAFIGRSILSPKSFDDTLNISLGRDKGIVVSRTKVDEFSKKRTVGLNKTDDRSFKIQVKNNKSQPVKITVYDQIPVSIVSDIAVTVADVSGGVLKNDTGEVKWELVLDPAKQTDLNLKYQVRYPKRESVVLE